MYFKLPLKIVLNKKICTYVCNKLQNNVLWAIPLFYSVLNVPLLLVTTYTVSFNAQNWDQLWGCSRIFLKSKSIFPMNSNKCCVEYDF